MGNRSVVKDLSEQRNCSFSFYISSKWGTYSVTSDLLDGSSRSLGVSDQKPFNRTIGCRPGHVEGVVGLVKGHQVWGRLQFTSCKVREKSSNMIRHVRVFHTLNSGSHKSEGGKFSSVSAATNGQNNRPVNKSDVQVLEDTGTSKTWRSTILTFRLTISAKPVWPSYLDPWHCYTGCWRRRRRCPPETWSRWRCTCGSYQGQRQWTSAHSHQRSWYLEERCISLTAVQQIFTKGFPKT